MNDLPKRKQLRLIDFDYSQNGYYFITICTHNRQNLFGQSVWETLCGQPNGQPVGATLCGRPDNPGKMIEKWLLELENKFYDVKICEYVIMPNHVHFIISKTGDHAGSPLRDIIGWFKTMTTNEYIANVKNNIFPPFDKKIWQRNYYEHIIRDENDYMTKAEYILKNPLKWEIEGRDG